MKNQVKKLLGLSVVATMMVVGCNHAPKSGVSKSNKEYKEAIKGAPDWVMGDLEKVAGYEKYSSVFLGRAEDIITSNDVDYSTNQATAKARANLAANLKATLQRDLQNEKTRTMDSEGKRSMSGTDSEKISQLVDKELVASKMLARYIGKDRVFVLVGLDKEIVEKVRAELGMVKKKK
ncbi:LPP20 family lipoprotein [Helicobacter cetorum]|uniref:Membrane-associated lipoprotein n=1 Tax=Helicobacter cetorum (strain ATCC BAA-540 / CCUG 52418 / MIT 99-5656) TaxID=1163745 RepID=I0EQI8_HELCM|nr:LPP20 family lipoprotein [Helicobacter cetorum]AFI05207.1 Membrane-associated lipoprotein [Helicobacter cetorum MIT 99-5656]